LIDFCSRGVDGGVRAGEDYSAFIQGRND